jgi:hypothetical protein
MDILIMVEVNEISIADIYPFTFPVKVFDRKGTPITEKTFSIAVDSREEEMMDTDDSGQMKILKPESSIKFTLKTPLSERNESRD